MMHHQEPGAESAGDMQERGAQETMCYLQQVVGEPPNWQESGGKIAAKLWGGAKQQMMFVKHNIGKDRELSRRVSDGDVPKRPDKVKPNPGDYIQEYGLNMDTDEDKKTPPTRPTATAAGSGSSTMATDVEQTHITKADPTARKLEFDELITKEDMNKLRGARNGDVPARPGADGHTTGSATTTPQPDWMMAMQSMFDKQGGRKELMFKGMDSRMNGLQDILTASTARTQQIMRDMEASFKHDICRNNEKQDQQFGEELRRLEMNIGGLSNNQPANASLEERMRKLELSDGAQKSNAQTPQTSTEDNQTGWQPRHVILGGW